MISNSAERQVSQSVHRDKHWKLKFMSFIFFLTLFKNTTKSINVMRTKYESKEQILNISAFFKVSFFFSMKSS